MGRVKELVELLNIYRNDYYNNNKNTVSDAEYDKLFDKLVELEKETGIVYVNSPTQNVGYEVKSELKKVRHNHPMLSLNKTQEVDVIVDFFKAAKGIAMLKMDGLTTSLKYKGANYAHLEGAETRGDGEVGEDVLHNAKTITNIPASMPSGDVVIDGEVIIDYETFEKINSKLPEDIKYKNPRNLASGSIRQLDSSIAKERELKFIAWKAVDGIIGDSFLERLAFLNELGFEVVPHIEIPMNSSKDFIQEAINSLQKIAREKGYPIDGIVFSYDSISYGESLGMTSHHPRNQIAFKFKNEEETSVLKNIDWQLGKTGVLTPVAEFDDVELYGTTVNRASLHNLSIMKELNIAVGKEISVTKANEIIPQITGCLSEQPEFDIPSACPVCGAKTEVKKDKDTEVLMCSNYNCKGKLLGQLTKFASKKAMDIKGLSEATLEKFIELGFVNSYKDIYHLENFADDISKLEGFGKRSVAKLLKAIEESRNCTLDRFICGLNIEGIGRSQSKALAKYFSYDITKAFKCWKEKHDYSQLEGIGDILCENINTYMMKQLKEVQDLINEMNFEEVEEKTEVNSDLVGKTFVVTGSVNVFKNRNEIKEKIESLGAKVTGSVTKNTNYLVCNEVSNSSKYKKAMELGVPIITEQDLVDMISL